MSAWRFYVFNRDDCPGISKIEFVMRNAIRVLVVLLLFPFGCSSDPYQSFLGLWEGPSQFSRDGSLYIPVIEIRKNGETYLVNLDVLHGNMKSHVLSKHDGQLSIDGLVQVGLGTGMDYRRALAVAAAGDVSVQIALGADKNTLFIGDELYKRTAPKRLEKIRALMKKEAEEQAKKNVLCERILKEFLDKGEMIRQRKDIDRSKQGELLIALDKEYFGLAKIEGCQRYFLK